MLILCDVLGLIDRLANEPGPASLSWLGPARLTKLAGSGLTLTGHVQRTPGMGQYF